VETRPAVLPEPPRPRSLADSLRAWDDQALTSLLTARADLLRPTPKDLSALAARATSGPSTSRCLDGLSRLDLHLLGTLVSGPWSGSVDEAALLQAAEETVRRTGADAPGLPQALAASLQRLRDLALVWGPQDELRPTHAVRDALGVAPRGQWPPQLLAVGAAVGGIAAEAGWQATECLSRTRALLDEWGLRPPAVLRTGGLGIRDFAAAREVLHADAPAAALTIELAWAAGLLASDDEATPRFVPTDGYDDWLELEPARAWAALAHAWLYHPRLPSLAGERANLLDAQLDRRAVPGMRLQVLGLLAQAPEDCPVSAASIEAVLDDRQPRGSGPLRQQAIEATLIEGTILGIVAAGALTQAGRKAAAGPLAPGSAVVGAMATAMAAAMPPLIDHVLVQADLTIIAPGPLVPAAQADLRRMADIESAGHATVYRLSAASLNRAMESGLDGPAIEDRLAELTATALPSTVRTLIADVARRHGGVRVGVAQAYVRCADPVLAASIVSDRSLQRLGLSRVDEHVLVASVPPAALLAALRTAGYPVAGETPEGKVLLPSQQPQRIPATRASVQVRRAGGGSVQAAVRALRSAESAQSTTGSPALSGADALEVDSTRRCAGPAAVALLRAAISDAESICLAYADADCGPVERLLDPIRIGGGTLTAFDHLEGKVRTFTLARISWAAPLAQASVPQAHPTTRPTIHPASHEAQS